MVRLTTGVGEVKWRLTRDVGWVRWGVVGGGGVRWGWEGCGWGWWTDCQADWSKCLFQPPFIYLPIGADSFQEAIVLEKKPVGCHGNVNEELKN